MRKLRIPHVYAILFALMILVVAASLLVPAGTYERDADGRVIPGTFSYAQETADVGAGDDAATPAGWELVFLVLQAPLLGIQKTGDIIAFILMVGGAFKVIERTGAFETAIKATVANLGDAGWLVVSASMLLFSVGGAVFGMGEEIIPFVLLFVPVATALGYHPMVGVAIPLIGTQVGFAGAMINPFTVGIAQAIAELPTLSGWQYRTAIWVVVTAIGIVYVERRSRTLRDGDAADLTPAEVVGGDGAELSGSQWLVLGSLAAGIGVILWGVWRFQWYVIELGAIFFAVGVVAGIVGRLGVNETSEAFVDGARDLVSAALVVGIARGVVVLAEEVKILDTVLHATASGLGELPAVLALNLMFVFQTCLNFFVPSGSGQAALTMPIMAPLAELVGLTRQMAVLAFQLGDGFSNMIIPTSAVLMGSLEAGKVRYERWFAFAWPLQVWLLLFGVVALSGAVAIGYGP